MSTPTAVAVQHLCDAPDCRQPADGVLCDKHMAEFRRDLRAEFVKAWRRYQAMPPDEQAAERKRLFGDVDVAGFISDVMGRDRR